MLNLNKKTYLLIFSTLYIIGLVLGGFFESIFYYFTLNGIFTLGGLWSVYFMMDNKPTPQKQPEPEIKKHVEKVEYKPVEKPVQKKQKPEPTGEVYVGEEITEEDLIRIKEDNRTWYSSMNKKIETSIADMKRRLNGEQEDTENGKN